MSTSIKLVGVKEAIADIQRLGFRVRKLHSRNAVSAAGGVMRREIERTAPEESGTLKRNIRVRIGVKKSTGDWYASIGARRKAKVKGVKSSVKQAVSFRKDGTAKRITEARAKKILAVGGRVGYRGPSRYIHLTEKRNASSAGYISAAAKGKATEAANAAIRQLQKAITTEARNG